MEKLLLFLWKKTINNMSIFCTICLIMKLSWTEILSTRFQFLIDIIIVIGSVKTVKSIETSDEFEASIVLYWTKQ